MKRRIFIITLVFCLMALSACKDSEEKKEKPNVSEPVVTEGAAENVPNEEKQPEEKQPEEEIPEVTYVYTLNIPKGYSATLNGVDYTECCELIETYQNPEFINVSEYVEMPQKFIYKTMEYTSEPVISVHDANGKEREYVIDEECNIIINEETTEPTMSQERKDEAYMMAKTWSDFVTSDLSGGYNGLDIVRKYLIRDSYYWNIAGQYATGVDITFISNHSIGNNTYTDLEINNYKEYGPDCYSCSISFTKNMLLNRTGKYCVDYFDMTIYFVNYDDTDDGVDNPHWAIADMIANVKNDESDEETFDENGIRIEEISGRSFKATLMIIEDPSQVFVGTVYDGSYWPENGKKLLDLVNDSGAVAGVNGGMYSSSGNKGGHPIGVIVQEGKITANDPMGYMVALDNNNKLIVKDISGMGSGAFASYVEEAGIRDAVIFQEDGADARNHFVSLVNDGQPRDMEGYGNGLNPRTVIGQREDGAIMLLTTDGRGAGGHIGASSSDLIEIMMKHNAVTAANLDGGSSTVMVYDGEYIMPCVTFYYHDSSWNLPSAFVVRGKDK